MSAPFQKFRIRESWNPFLGWGTFIVKVWPIGPQGEGWMDENISRHQSAQEFISNSIKEKLDKEK